MKLYTDVSMMGALQNAYVSACVYGNIIDNDLKAVTGIPGFLLVNMGSVADGYFLSPCGTSISATSPAEMTELTAPPSGPMLLWSFEKDGLPELQRLADALNSKYLRSRFAADSGDIVQLQAQLMTLLARDAATYVKRCADLNSALSQLRQEHDLTRKVLQNMQDILWNIRGNPPRMTSVTKLGLGRITLDILKKQGANGFVQKLLVPSKGLAGIDIYVAEGCKSPGYLNAELSVAATGEKIASWRIPYPDITQGWLHFPLSTILALSYPSVDLRISFFSPHDDSPRLGLTDDGVLSSAFIQINGQPQTGKMLSMRTWGGFPGIKNELVASHLLEADHSAFFEYKLPPSVLSELKLCADFEAGFPVLNVDSEGVVLLHPLRDIIVSAYAPSALPRGVRQIEAEVIVNGNCPSTAEFAVAAVPQHLDPASINPDTAECVGSSGWMPISRNFSRELVGFTLAEPFVAEELDLYLFTRVPGGHSVDYCQAQFVSIKVAMDANKATTITESSSLLKPSPDHDLKNDSKSTLSLDETVLAKGTPLHSFNFDFDSFRVLPGKGIMLHPVSNHINVAILPGAVPVGTTRIAADIRIGSRCASQVTFGLALPNGKTDPTQIEVFDPEDIEAFLTASQSLRIGNNSDTIVFNLPGALPSASDLFLFTLLEEGESMDYTDSYFENIRFMVG
jgi:hypothetical protein